MRSLVLTTSISRRKGQIQNQFPSSKTIQTRKMLVVSRINTLVDKKKKICVNRNETYFRNLILNAFDCVPTPNQGCCWH